MQIQLPPTTEAFVRGRAAAAGFDSVEHYIHSLVLRDEAGTTAVEQLSKDELGESLAMIDRGMEDVKAGRMTPAKEALREIASELGLKIDR